MSYKFHHAITRAEYTAESEDRVLVVERDAWGRFDAAGYWLEGNLRQCDPQMCRWLTSKVVMQRLAAGTYPLPATPFRRQDPESTHE
jgi:hypothetical protein